MKVGTKLSVFHNGDCVVVPNLYEPESDTTFVVYDRFDDPQPLNVPIVHIYNELYEKKITEPEKCGLSLGKACCRYLVESSENEFTCERFSWLRESCNYKAENGLQENVQKPSRLEPPNCQREVTLASLEEQFIK
jgi:hypothetical protein